MNPLILNLVLSSLKAILCQFCECCEENDDCPDGVCGDLRAAVDELDSAQPAVSATRPMAPNFEFDWGELQPTITAAAVFVRQLLKFLGVTPKVG
ncbi:MAG: hypothetical protein AAFP90_20215 [Planctomycetota bacterium]